ncbi:MAG: GNAT family N-acetyltransferase [Dehalococcoidia bacterium]
MTVRPFQPEDLAGCAELFSARHRKHRSRLPMLARSFEDPAATREVLDRAAANRRVTKVVAERDGSLVGFLFGEEQLFPPDHFASQYIPPQSADIGVDAHAVALDEDVTDVYRAMYTVLADDFAAHGLFTHRIHFVPDAEVQEAWVTLGFGRHLVAATRDTGIPVDGTRAAGIEVHQASAEDIDVVMSLADSLNAHHLRAPIFWPILPAPQPAAREYNLAHLADTETNPYFVGYHENRPVAMQTFNKPGFIPSVVEPESNIYLFEGVVEEDVRTGGVGAALLDRTMAHLRDRGIRWCTLHFASGNPQGAPFWLKHQFIPVEYEMERRIDERVAWARG